MIFHYRRFWTHPVALLACFSLVLFWFGKQAQDKKFLSQQIIDTLLKEHKETILKFKPVYFVSQSENELGMKEREELFVSEVSKFHPIKLWEPQSYVAVQLEYPKESFLTIRFESRGHFVTAHMVGSDGWNTGKVWLEASVKRIYATWISLFPALVGFLLILWTRKVVLPICTSVFLGALILENFDVFSAVQFLVQKVIWGQLTNFFHISIIVFSFCFVCMIQLFQLNGGMAGLIRQLERVAQSRLSSQLVTFVMGLILFFDDYTKPVLVGTTMRSLFDKFRLSRAKLAFIVDSTSAPVAALSVFSTWAIYEVGLLQGVLKTIDLPFTGYEMFFKMLPFRFYSWFALMIVFFTIIFQRDFKSILILRGKVDADISQDIVNKATPSLWRLLLPLFVFMASSLGAMTFHGWKVVENKLWSESLEFFNLVQLFQSPIEGFKTLGQYIFHSSNMVLLAISSIFSLGVAIICSWGQPVNKAISRSARMYRGPVSILLSAWCLNVICLELKVGDFFISVIPAEIAGRFFPLVAFMITAMAAFITGSGWGVMGIFVPILLPLAFQLGGLENLILTSAAVLEGSVFGNHTSPVSDTAVISSMSTGCDHLVHIRTQLQYASLGLISASIFGFLLAAHSIPFGISYFLGASFIMFLLMIFARPVPRWGEAV